MQYLCLICGARYIDWQGKCNQCNSWNSIIKLTTPEKSLENGDNRLIESNKKLNDIALNLESKYQTRLKNFNKILNGGFLPGQVLLLSGEPGIGKSTLVAQICKNVNFKVLYISGEENLSQIKHRLLRIGSEKDFENVDFQNITELELILANIKSQKYNLIIIDSIQTVYSRSITGNPGSQGQIKMSGQKLVEYGKQFNTTILLIAQINKEGLIAGPKLLEHIVDTVLYFEGDRKSETRILKVIKNRYGFINEIAVYKMESNGLIEIENIESYYSGNIQNNQPGVTFSICNQGNTYFIIEVQALCVGTYFNYPKRISNGFDNKRLEMIIAVLSKKLHQKLEKYDIYVNILGGIQIDDTGLDLAVACSIMSSIKNVYLPPSTCFIGELSLIGDIRNAFMQSKRIEKAKNFGFKNIISNQKYSTLQEVFENINLNLKTKKTFYKHQ